MQPTKLIELDARRVRLQLHELSLSLVEFPGGAPLDMAFFIAERLQIEVAEMEAAWRLIIDLHRLLDPVAGEIGVDHNYDAILETAQRPQDLVEVDDRQVVRHPVAVLVTMARVVKVDTMRLALDRFFDLIEKLLLVQGLEVQ